MTQTPTPDDEYGWLDGLLDSHAKVYAQTTMEYITDTITEDDRDKEWHHSDLKTKKAIISHIQQNYTPKPATICGRTIEEIILILNSLDLERETDIIVTMENLNQYCELLRQDMRKAVQGAMRDSLNRALYKKDNE